MAWEKEKRAALQWAQQRYGEALAYDKEGVPVLELWQVAELSGYSNSATHQWRRRTRPDYDGKDRMAGAVFPDPVQPGIFTEAGGRQSAPRWSIDDVMDWLCGGQADGEASRWVPFSKRRTAVG
jgi:hypothetical protein